MEVLFQKGRFVGTVFSLETGRFVELKVCKEGRFPSRLVRLEGGMFLSSMECW